MNILEAVGLVFILIVVVNLVFMIWAIKKARMLETLNIDAEQEA